MTPWTLLDSGEIPGGGELLLYRRGEEYSIAVKGGGELMSSRVHGSEEALAELGCGRIAERIGAQVLIGGLGMGYTLAAALRQLAEDARVVVAELVPAVVAWNRDPLGHFAGNPLDDPRCEVRVGDVAREIRWPLERYDAILLDVDNGPEGLTRRANDELYSTAGLERSYDALRPGGVLAVWSAGPEPAFSERLRRVGFEVEEHRVRAHGGRKGAHHTLWLAGVPD